jgi:hypothetical protein
LTKWATDASSNDDGSDDEDEEEVDDDVAAADVERAERSDSSCSARATSSLPVPLSPVISTVAVESATSETMLRTALAASLHPM